MINIAEIMPLTQYIEKGLLVDIYPLIDADLMINRNDIVEVGFDITIMNIIREAARDFINDQKDIDDTVRIIQNRAMTYIAEHSD